MLLLKMHSYAELLDSETGSPHGLLLLLSKLQLQS